MGINKLFAAEPCKNRIPKSFLFAFTAIALMTLFQDLGLFNIPEAFLSSGLLSASIIYWVPPRPNKKYFVWILQCSLAIGTVYLVWYKIPDLFRLKLC
jgi:hypothetical protein